MGIDFDSNLGKLQRLMAESIAGTTRRNAILNELEIHGAFRAHCSHQMLPMELPGNLERRGFKNIEDKSLAFVITKRNYNSPARYSEAVMANFALSQGVSAEEVSDWKSQLEKAEQQGRFGFVSFPVLTSAHLS